MKQKGQGCGSGDKNMRGKKDGGKIEVNTTRRFFLPSIMSACVVVCYAFACSFTCFLHCAMHINECDACAARMCGETACLVCFDAICCLRDATLLDSGYEHALLSTS